MAGVTTPPSFYAMPTAYNGRTSSIVISGTSIHRPRGMLRPPGNPAFEFEPSQRMDYELEMGFFVSKSVPFGKTIKGPEEAKEHIFGFVMLNDWSARDVQFSEMIPLGPFNGKGSATTISPWVVMPDALVGAEVEIGDGMAKEKMGEMPIHLRHLSEQPAWNIKVEVALNRETYNEPVIIASSNLADLYWTPAQMLSHHASSGCGMRTGDLLGTGTISSRRLGRTGTSSFGCLHEATEAGQKPFTMMSGEAVTWLQDGDEVILTGKVIKSDGTSLGFGDCSGQLRPVMELD